MDNIARKTLVKRLAGYSTLALAGLAAEPAVAAVVYSGPGFTPVTIGPGEIKAISFGGSLGNLFQFAERSASSGYSALIQRGANAVDTQSIVRIPSFNDPKRLPSGYTIGPGAQFYPNAAGTANDIGGISAGSWNASNGTTVRGYLGIRFALPDGFRYGYFDVGYDNTPTQFDGTMTVYGWAYENAADTGLVTGPTVPGTVPEPATALPLGLGLLALGAAGIRAKRKNVAA